VPPQTVLFIHGYSETSLAAYHSFPRLLSDAGLNVRSMFLSAFDSLDDQISIDDLAAGLADRIAEIENDPAVRLDVTTCALICHSTGALIARRWMLNRIAEGKTIPSHFISIAGANHGSSLAQAGKSLLGYAQKLLLTPAHALTVGQRVLTDLDYGSDFLLRLNCDWLTQINTPSSPLSACYIFSMGGDFIGRDPMMKLVWGSCETGSDNTVRISGANLNYRILEVDLTFSPPKLTPLVPLRQAPHIILTGYSHYDADTGIIGRAKDHSDSAFQRTLQALRVENAGQYQALAQDWQSAFDRWCNPDPPIPGRLDDVNATVVFSVVDRGESPIEDCMIAFLDAAKVSDPTDPLALPGEAVDATLSVAKAINDHSPIHNNVQRGSYSFYLNWPAWKDIDHVVHVEAHSPSPRIVYQELNYAIAPEIGKLIRPNEFTYVSLRLLRDADPAYALYQWSADLNLGTITWGPDKPFPPGSLPTCKG
jgi:hypothetical protein